MDHMKEAIFDGYKAMKNLKAKDMDKFYEELEKIKLTFKDLKNC